MILITLNVHYITLHFFATIKFVIKKGNWFAACTSVLNTYLKINP